MAVWSCVGFVSRAPIARRNVRTGLGMGQGAAEFHWVRVTCSHCVKKCEEGVGDGAGRCRRGTRTEDFGRAS